MSDSQQGLTGAAQAQQHPRSRWVLHVDLDQFIAAVEIQRRPELAGRPVVVGGSGDPTRPRQVVATASYEARAFGVSSGMPLRRAHRLCPDAVFLPSDPPAYQEASTRVMDSLRRLPVRVEVRGWDEAFVGTDTDDPAALAHRIQAQVRADTGLSCAVGIGDNKLRAKIATGLAKPGGVASLTARTWRSVMGERSPQALWGIGRRTADALATLGITTVAALADADPNLLAATFGPKTGPWLRLLGQGVGSRVVVTEPWLARSHSHETTYPVDLTDRGQIRHEVVALARRVAADVSDEGRTVSRVVLKVRFAPFRTQTHAVALTPPSRDGPRIVQGALDALGRFDMSRPVRLLGVRAELVTEEPDA